jgi:hypothetical protein
LIIESVRSTGTNRLRAIGRISVIVGSVGIVHIATSRKRRGQIVFMAL